MHRIGDFPLGEAERRAIERVMDSNRVSEHREVREFEQEFADWLGVKYVVATSSGTAALICGLTALKYDSRYPQITDNCRVRIPALTFIATANAVMLSGMIPQFGDVELPTMTLDPESIKSQDDLVMPVHLFGFVADMPAIQERANLVVEDACEAHGSVLHGKKAGTMSIWSAFSFYIAHTVQAGEMGCVATDDGEIARSVRRIKAHGRACDCVQCVRGEGICPYQQRGPDPRYQHLEIGYNFKPMEFQAALARVQLERIDENIERRRENVLNLNDKLKNVDETLLPAFDENVAYMAYPIILNDGIDRNKVLQSLERRGVECRPLFGCIPTQQPAYAHLRGMYVPIAEFLGRQGFFVGCHQYLTDDDIDDMSNAIKEAVA